MAEREVDDDLDVDVDLKATKSVLRRAISDRRHELSDVGRRDVANVANHQNRKTPAPDYTMPLV